MGTSRLWLRAVALPVLACALAAGGRATGAEGELPGVPPAAVEAVVDAAKALSRKGHADLMREAFEVARELGADEDVVTRERDRAERRLKMVRRPAKRLGDVARLLGKAIDAIVPLLGPAGGTDGAGEGGREDGGRNGGDEAEARAASRRALAEVVLRLDSDCDEARAVLGHVRGGGGWIPAHVARCLERRAAVDRALLEARRLEVPVELGTSDSRLLEGLYGRPGRVARWGRVSVHGVGIPDQKLARVLREAVRATALARFLLGDKLALPKVNGDCAIDWLDSTPRYMEAVDWCLRAGVVSRTDADFKRSLRSFVYGAGRRVCAPRPEARMQTILLEDVWTEALYAGGLRDPQATLKAGHLNWVCLSYIGAGLPSYGWKETKEETRGTSDLDAEARRRHEMWRLSEAGLLGSRSWLRYLAERGEDPAWSRTFKREMGMIKGDDLLKATFMTQYLAEMSELGDMLRATDDQPAETAVFEKATGGPLADVERRFHEWLLAPDRRLGLLQRIGGAKEDAGAPAPTAAEQDLLDYLHGMRQAAVPGNVRADVVPLALDAELSAGCAAHAAYLALHPDQAAAWPDAHEEWPDREGFSPAGGWAGLHSVIAPGSRSPRDAVDGWMATFYHRLPLLDPGLVRIGWGFEKGNAVLDAGSMVAPFRYVTRAVWPPPRGTGVPRGFAPELPNPVPGADQSAWGYPITLQLFRSEGVPDVTMTLREGRGPGGPAVPCHVATPQHPTNPELAPAGTYCLIPKSRLAADTTYTVVVHGVPDEDALQWSFTTGR